MYECLVDVIVKIKLHQPSVAGLVSRISCCLRRADAARDFKKVTFSFVCQKKPKRDLNLACPTPSCCKCLQAKAATDFRKVFNVEDMRPEISITSGENEYRAGLY